MGIEGGDGVAVVEELDESLIVAARGPGGVGWISWENVRICEGYFKRQDEFGCWAFEE